MATIKRGSTASGKLAWSAAQPIALVPLDTKPPTPEPPIPPKPEPPKPEPPKPEPPKPQPPKPMTLTLRALNGQYVCAELDGTLNANRDAIGAWERFIVEPQSGGWIALKTAHGQYVCAEGGGGSILIANRPAVGPWEQFKTHQVGQGIALETWDGHYWCAEDGGGREVNATRTAIGPWETFNTPTPPPPGSGRRGQVRGEKYATADEDGVWLAQGTSLFWGLWGWQHDRERFLANVDCARAAGMDFLRIFGTVGSNNPGDGWFDRRVDCGAPNWASDVAACTEAVHQRGMRVQWTIFGSTSYAPTKGDRRAAVEKLCRVLQPVSPAVFSVEIANEGWQNGFPDAYGASELKDLALVSRSLGPWLVATTAPRIDSCEAQAPYYKDSACTEVTLHFARTNDGEGGEWRYVRQPWREGTKQCSGQAPLYANNEPKELAGKGDHNFLRVAFSTVVSWQCNVGAYVLHTGAGIRGGGAADLAAGRAANLWDVPGWTAVTEAMRTAKQILPNDLTLWSRGSSKPPMWEVSDWSAVDRVYTSTSGKRFLSTPMNISKPFSLTAKQRLHCTVYNPLTWAELRSVTLSAGQSLAFSTSPGAVVILGELR